MSEEQISQPTTIHELTEQGREKLAQAQDGAEDVWHATAEYVRDNPWVAMAGAAVLGGVIVALCRRKPEPTNLDAMREWLEEGYAKLPSKKQMKNLADDSGVSGFLKKIADKISLAS